MTNGKIEATNWEDREVLVPMNHNDLDTEIMGMKDWMERYIKASIAKKTATDALKEVEAEKEGYVSRVASRKCVKKVPARWVFDWKSGTKKQVALLENHEIHVVSTHDISEYDKQGDLTRKPSDETESYAELFR